MNGRAARSAIWLVPFYWNGGRHPEMRLTSNIVKYWSSEWADFKGPTTAPRNLRLQTPISSAAIYLPPPPPPKKRERQKKANPQRKAFSLFWLENAERLPRLHFRSKWWFFFSLITRWGRSEWNEMEWNGWHGFYGFSMSSPKFKATKQSGKIESWGGKNGKNRRKKHRSCHWHPIKTTQAREDPIKTEVKPFKSDKRPIKTR